jgi:putative mRNA 3-end processing factor
MRPLIRYDNGIQIDGLEFRLDAHRRCDYSFVSHAHSDHARKHERVLATPETALLYRDRYPQVSVRAIPCQRRVKFGKATVELFASGHMLGAAQILIEVAGTRIVYTGDFKVYPNLTCPPVEHRRCDVLIMESTYGDPAFAFPPQNEVYTRIVAFVRRAQVDGYSPVLVGYAMGKAQEAVSLMQRQGFSVAVDANIARVTELYRKAGVKLDLTPLYTKDNSKERVLVLTPQTLRSDEYKALRRTRSLFLSGWSQSSARRGFGADLGVPLSDHADFSQLISYIERCKPQKIYTLHGEPKFAKLLREMGYDAEYMYKDFRSDQSTARKVDLTQHGISLGKNFELF